MKSMLGRWMLAAVLLVGTGPALAVTSPQEMLDDPALEQRAREISKELRCLVCQNQSIDDSDAPLARDLRQIVRERLNAGDSDAEVLAYATARYGDFVLLRPPVRGTTWLLWYGPALLIVVGGIGAFAWVRRQHRAPRVVEPLSEQERAELDRVLGERT